MISRLLSFVWPVALAASLLSLYGCAGSKARSSSGGSESSSSAEEMSSQRVEDARRSAEEAELAAHRLRAEKSKSQSKSSSN